MAFPLQYTLCFIGFLMLLPLSTYAQTYSNVSLERSLAADDSNSSWKSPSGEFAFGFQQIANQGFLLAIWFDKIPEKTIVWSANRNELVQKGSGVQLTTDGQLVLSDPKGSEIWTSPSGAAYAAMLDTGNFVLADESSVYLWQSFDEPTDTLLPTQTMNLGSKLVSRYSKSNYSRGRYQFLMQGDANLVLYTTTYPLETTNVAYWSAQISGSNFQVVFDQSGNLYVAAAGNGSIIFNVSSSGVSMNDFYQRVVLEYDGVFRHYVYPKTSSSSNGGSMAWSAVLTMPPNICTAITEQIGTGACGFNSYCKLGDDQRPICMCPPEYTFVDSDDPMKGCIQNFVPQSCEGGETSKEANLFEFREMSSINWPFNDYARFEPVTKDWCKQECIRDCFCAVAIYGGDQCWKKRNPLSNGMTGPGVYGTALVKVRKDNLSSIAPSPCQKPKKDQSTLIRTGSVLSGSMVFILLILATAFVCFHFRKRKSVAPQPREEMLVMSARSFAYGELEKATDGFKEELGCGAFGTVYKGVLEFESNIPIAVKRLNKMVSEGEKEFKTEVSTISRTNHKNLVQLLGFCNEGESRLLVYEYMSNGSLADYLFGDSMPNWYTRIEVAFGIARGLLYLHEECSNQIIHCDIKPQNILLDDSFVARISDFGLAKHLKADQTRTTTGIRGTRGYVAPEWFKSIPITAKVDVYSFGVLFLELICCRKNYEPEAGDENQVVLTDWAYDCCAEGKVHLLVQNDEEAMNDLKSVEKFVMIAVWCIQEDPSLRPTMKKVTQMLEGAVQVPVPSEPNSFISCVQTVA